MNFGEKLKQLRTEKNMTQPQLAEAIGIEQSYLSKLENDKSVPSAEMFQSIIKTLEIEAKDFLQDIDRKILQGPLKQIPEVSNYINASALTRVHNAKKWLIGSAAAIAVGLTLMAAVYDQVFFSNTLYKYVSKGVILKNESDDIFGRFVDIQSMRAQGKIITWDERHKLIAEFEATRVQPVLMEVWDNKGTVFFQTVENGRRRFDLIGEKHIQSIANKVLQLLGALLVFCGVLGFFIEWRLRSLRV